MPADALKCKECQTTYPLEARYVCDRCFGPLEVSYTAPGSSAEELKRRIQAGPNTLWRYADFLPLEGTARSALPTGWTPLVKADRLAERLGLGEVWVRQIGRGCPRWRRGWVPRWPAAGQRPRHRRPGR